MKTDNDKIAEFMGANKSHVNGIWLGGDASIKHFLHNSFSSELHFHDSWDWLMPVVNKIGEYTLAHPDKVAHVTQLKVIVEFGVLYQRVVEFISWYNNTSQTLKK